MLFTDSYNQIQLGKLGFYRELGSKFIAYPFLVYNKKDINDKISFVKKKERSANHYCYAYILHPDSSITRANDGGEPNSSAGKPILNQLRKFELTNVLVVVVRHFGGKKLGIPGLIRSYKNATNDSLQRSIIINKKIMEQYDIEFNQEEMSFVMSFIKNNNIEIYRNLYTSKNKLTINVQKNKSIDMLRLFKEKKIKILYKKIV